MLRYLLASVLLFVSTLTLKAEDPYFCVREGARLHYVRTSVGDGSVAWRHTMGIDRVATSDSGKSVNYNSLFTKANGGRMYGGPVALTVSVSADGDVRMSVAESLASVFANVVGARNVRQEGGVTTLPSDMKPGDVLPDISGSASAGPMKITVSVTDRKVLGEETLKTPAGTFECVVVQEHKVEKGVRNRVTTSRTWYARGVGMVRHDTYDRNMKLDTSEVLQSIE